MTVGRRLLIMPDANIDQAVDALTRRPGVNAEAVEYLKTGQSPIAAE
jgi:hypothetical protein